MAEQSTKATPHRVLRPAVVLGLLSAWFLAGGCAGAPFEATAGDQAGGSLGAASGSNPAVGGGAGTAEASLGGRENDASPGGAAGEPTSLGGGAAEGACATLLTECSGDCVNLRTDHDHCGSCGNDCGPGASCRQGECISTSGCSDRSREAFLPLGDFPRIAGCAANWPRASLRTATTGVACGDDLGLDCQVPADACAEGWRVCAVSRGAVDVSNKATASECAAQPGAFAAAVGDVTCDCDLLGNVAACCGTACTQRNGNCLYPGATAGFASTEGVQDRCGDVASSGPSRGVMCCRD